jgi:DnaK suppressor protein
VTKTAASKAPAKKAPAVADEPKAAAKAPAPVPAPVAAAAPVAAPAAAPKAPAPRSRSSSRYANAPAPAPLPPSTSRFADRFAPAHSPSRPLFQPEAATSRAAATKADPKLANAWKTKAGRDLSEEELVAMPEAEYMNDKQLEFFRARLQKLKDDLLSNADETTEHLREDTSIVPDPADRATIEEEHALELRTRDRERKLLKKISQSLGRIDSGEYGFCDETGEPIGIGRLLARPTATLSLEAQQRRELKQKMFGD